MDHLTKHYSTTNTPQTEPIPGRADMVPNNAGGYGWQVDKWHQLERFLVLGTQGGTYYLGERELTVQNCNAAMECIKEDGPRVVKTLVEISDAGRARKNDYALFVLAMAAKHGDRATKEAANANLHRVARIGTHLFHYARYIKNFGGWGTGQTRWIGRWYTKKDPAKLAYQMVKYQQRDGWSHADLLRLCHPKPPTPEHNALFRWAIKGMENDQRPVGEVPDALRLVWAFEQAKLIAGTASKASKDQVRQVIKLVQDYRLPHEAVPNSMKKDPEMWDALLQSMPPGAVLRNMGRFQSLGMLSNTSDAMKQVRTTLLDAEKVKRARLHPLSVLVALVVYKQGHGGRGNLNWDPCSKGVDTLDELYYMSFGTVEPTGKRLCLAVDVSGSMDWATISDWGNRGGWASRGFKHQGEYMPITPRVAAAAMSMVTARVEDQYEIVGFSHNLVHLDVSPRQRLDDIVGYMKTIPMGGTDCALPVKMAIDKRIAVDAFVLYTDNETWHGSSHVVQLLQQYRQQMGVAAKLITVNMVANQCSVADPTDAGMLDCVGFDTSVPNVISSFIRE
jgi:60 kDa SS-A/Ro ribonucleoprotein